MRPALRQYLRAIEASYGKLGEAQVQEFSRLLEEDSGFRHRDTGEQWRFLNLNLAEPDYEPPTRDEVMHTLFKSGEEYPDIFNGNLENVDMNDLL